MAEAGARSDEGRAPFMERVGGYAGVFAEQFVPDPWIYAIALTGVAYLAAVIFTDAGPWGAAEAWQTGLWNKNILVLIAQFSFNLIVCTALARTPLLRWILAKLASLPKSPFAAIWLVAVVSILLGLISWALCIIGGAIFAGEVCRQGRKRGLALHYPLAIGAGYIGMMTFGLGLTSSAPLIVSSPDHTLARAVFAGREFGDIPFADTVGSVTSLGTLGVLLLVCPVLLGAMHPRSKVFEIDLDEAEAAAEDPSENPTFAERLENSWLMLKAAAILPLAYLINEYFIQGKGISINSMNLTFLCAALLLYSTPKQMLDELARASQGVWSIVFQFPFYAGLMGIITQTGLGVVVADGFVSVATRETWPLLGVAFQGLCNLFVPSAGGQWFVTGEILTRTSTDFGYSIEQAVMIEVMGDQLTNMIQPMWALPALALSGLKARHILGYTAVVMVVAFVIMAAALSFFPL